MENITTNRKANFEYFILKKFTAGLVLVGSEVKSIRNKHVNINDSFILFRNGEAFVHNMFIKTYENTKNFALDEKRTRKLLLNKYELKELAEKSTQKGLTVVPLRLFFDRNLVKIEIALCKGKLLHDKRETIKKRDQERDIRRELKSS